MNKLNNDKGTNMNYLESWQNDYEGATNSGGKVADVYGEMGRMGGLAIIVEVEEGGETVFYSPYLNSSPYDDCPIYDVKSDALDKLEERLGRELSCFDLEETSHNCTGHDFDLDNSEWISAMAGATDWSEWNWGGPMDSVPLF